MGIILDVDGASQNLLNQTLYEKEPISGIWGYKVGDKILSEGLANTLRYAADYNNIFADLKHYDVSGRIARIIKLYADMGEYAPKFLTISGECTLEALQEAVSARGNINIIITTILSDRIIGSNHRKKLAVQAAKAFHSGAQGITCPAWLLPSLPERVMWNSTNPIIVATGVVSDGVNPRHHVKPKTIEFALKHRATHVVVGTEVTANPDPLATLRKLGARAEACLKTRA